MKSTSNEVDVFDPRDVNGKFQYNKKDKSDLRYCQDSQLIDLKRETLRMESLRKEMKMELANMHESFKKDLLKEMQKMLKKERKN